MAGRARPGSARSPGRRRGERAVARIVGKRRSQNSAPRCRASSHMCGWPVSIIRRVIALATTSRGARSASSCTPCMNRLPSKSTRNAPSPRTASEISGCWPRESGPRYITVGWNCTNSRSRSTAPARSASAIPSPVETAGLVVWENTWPRPPLASTTARQRTAPTPSRWPSPITCRVTPGDAAVVGEQQVDGERVLDHLDLGRLLDRRRSAPAGSRRRWRRRRRARSGRGGGRPRGSARARRRGRGRSSVPSAISSRTASGPSVTSTRTASRSHAPAPATRVSTLVLLGGVLRARARRRCRPAPTGSSRRRARPW